MVTYRKEAFLNEISETIYKSKSRSLDEPKRLAHPPYSQALREEPSKFVTRNIAEEGVRPLERAKGENYLNFEPLNIGKAFLSSSVVVIPKEKERLELIEELKKIGKHYKPERLEDEIERLDYKEFVSQVYRSLNMYGKTPIDLTYDLLNEMARELYQHAKKKHPSESASFTLAFENSKVLAKQLKELRKSLNISTWEVSRHADISHCYISQIEHHKYNPTIISLGEYLIGLKRAYSRRQI